MLGASQAPRLHRPVHGPDHRPGRARPLHRQARLTGGSLELADGIGIVVVAVGVFAVGEALWTAAHLRRKPVDVIPVGRPFMGRDDWRPILGAVAARHRAGLPVRRRAGRRRRDADVPVLPHRAQAREARGAREFGEGAIEGVAGPEAANNASAAGMFVPLLALGLPVTATASILLAAMQSYGIVPGPTLMTDQPDLVWTLLASLLIGNTLLLVINLPLAPLWARLLTIPRPAAVRRHPVLRLAGRLQRQPGPVRPGPAAGLRPARLRHPAVRHPRPAADPRRDPRPADGGQAPRGARPLRRRDQRPVQRAARDLLLRADRPGPSSRRSSSRRFRTPAEVLEEKEAVR